MRDLTAQVTSCVPAGDRRHGAEDLVDAEGSSKQLSNRDRLEEDGDRQQVSALLVEKFQLCGVGLTPTEDHCTVSISHIRSTTYERSLNSLKLTCSACRVKNVHTHDADFFAERGTGSIIFGRRSGEFLRYASDPSGVWPEIMKILVIWSQSGAGKCIFEDSCRVCPCEYLSV